MGYLTMLFLSTTAQLNLPPKLLEAICYVESGHSIHVVHAHDGDSNSIGVCQIKLKTAQWLGFEGTEEDLIEPETNIYYAGLYLKHQLLRYHFSYNRAIIAYNRGHAGDLTFTKYSDKVFKQWSLNEHL